MKTKDLIKKVNIVKGLASYDEGYRVTFYEVGRDFPFYTMDKKTVDFGQGVSNFANLHDTNMCRLSYVIDVIREYLETPLAEREDEKRYWLQRIEPPILGEQDPRYLFYTRVGSYYDIGTTKSERHNVIKTIFTESEIAEMDITGFEKIEVTEC